MSTKRKNPIEALEKQIWELAAKNEFERAVDFAHETRQMLAGSALSNSARVEHVQSRADILEDACRLPTKQRLALAGTHRAASTVDRLCRREAYDKGAELTEKLLWIREGILGGEHPLVASAYTALGIFRMLQRDSTVAERCFARAIDMTSGKALLEFAHASRCYGCFHTANGAYETADPLFHDALTAYHLLFGWEHEDVARCLVMLSMLAGKRGDENERRKLLGETMLAWAKWFAYEYPKLARRLADPKPLKNLPREIPKFWRDDDYALGLLRAIFQRIVAQKN